MLDPILELDFWERQHRYRWRGNWILNNVSSVISDELTPYVKAQIEKYKHGPDGWQTRGDALHHWLQAFLKKESFDHDERWDPWVDALLADNLFKDIEVLATEYSVVDRYNSVAGSFDFLIRDSNSRVILGDLKTVSSAKSVSSRKPATAQLGAYCKFLNMHVPLLIDECITVVSGPGKCKVIRQSPQDECIPAWEEAWGRFEATQPKFDF